MKINGQTPGLSMGSHDLTRPDGRIFKLKLTAMPLGWPTVNESLIPDPIPPVEFAKDARGAVQRDAFGNAVTRSKTDDPDYLKNLGRAQFLRGIHTVFHALRNDPSVTFDATDKEFASTADRMSAIADEMCEAGITDSEIVAIIDKVRDLNRGRVERVEAERDSFLPGTSSVPDGASPKNTDTRKNTSSTESPNDSEPEEKTPPSGSPGST